MEPIKTHLVSFDEKPFALNGKEPYMRSAHPDTGLNGSAVQVGERYACLLFDSLGRDRKPGSGVFFLFLPCLFSLLIWAE